MDDSFLYQIQETPNPEFVDTLHRNLEQYYPKQGQVLRVTIIDWIRGKRLAQAVALFLIGLFALMTLSPVRAFVTTLLTEIAGQVFVITGDYPGDNEPGGETIIEPQIMSLNEALAVFPYDIHVPTDLPTGLILDDSNVRVYVGEDAGPFANSIELEWYSDGNSHLSLRVTDRGVQNGEIVAPDATEKVSLDANHSAALIRGGWDADAKMWNYDLGYRLRWSVDSLMYDLRGVDPQQLIEIAKNTL